MWNFMLIAIAHAVHQESELYVIGINMILQTVFAMFVDFKNWVRDNMGRQDARIAGVVKALCLMSFESLSPTLIDLYTDLYLKQQKIVSIEVVGQ